MTLLQLFQGNKGDLSALTWLSRSIDCLPKTTINGIWSRPNTDISSKSELSPQILLAPMDIQMKPIKSHLTGARYELEEKKGNTGRDVYNKNVHSCCRWFNWSQACSSWKALQLKNIYLFSLKEASFASMVWFKRPSKYDYLSPIQHTNISNKHFCMQCQEWDNMLWCFWNTGNALMQSCHITTWVQSEFMRYFCLNVRILLSWRKGTAFKAVIVALWYRLADRSCEVLTYFDAPVCWCIPALLITLRKSGCQISFIYSETKANLI